MKKISGGEIGLDFHSLLFLSSPGIKRQKTRSKIKKGGSETTTLGVCWNLIGHEGNISSVAARLPATVNKAARINKSRISEDQITSK